MLEEAKDNGAPYYFLCRPPMLGIRRERSLCPSVPLPSGNSRYTVKIPEPQVRRRGVSQPKPIAPPPRFFAAIRLRVCFSIKHGYRDRPRNLVMCQGNFKLKPQFDQTLNKSKYRQSPFHRTGHVCSVQPYLNTDRYFYYRTPIGSLTYSC